MAKFHGFLGFIESVETSPGVYEEVPTEREVRGDILRDSRQWDASQDQVNDNLVLNNRFSFVLSPYIYDNIGALRFIKVRNVKWIITGFTINDPRIIVTVGGVYNG